ncbi:MAG: polysaccharide biosynthesis C-terminal domain-containing protein [Clostridia bacterium]|nr:polysaccharide biosynthesis C-terminal domain-containing protein [Clostridia bacterium]
MNRYKKLASNTIALSLGTMASKVLVYLLLPLYTACLDKSQYSQSDIITQTANLLLPLLAVGMVDGIFRFAMDSTDEAGRASVFCVSFWAVTSGSVVALCLTPLFDGLDFFGGYGWLIPLYVVASNFHSCAAHFLRGCGKTKLFSLQGIVTTALTIAFNLVFLLGFDMGVPGYVLSTVLADAVLTLFLFFYAGLYRYLSWRHLNRDTAKSMLKYSLPMIPTTIFWWITNVSDRYMIKANPALGDAVNGLYAAAFKVPTLLILVSGIFIEAWNYSAVTDDDSQGGESSFFTQVFGGFQAVVFACAAGLIFLAKPICSVLFAKSYGDAWQYIPVLVYATVFSSLVTFMSSVYVKCKKSKNSFVTAMIGAVVNVALNFILIPVYGAHGAAVATFVCYLVVYIIRAIDSARYVKFNKRWLTVGVNTLLIGTLCTVVLLEINYWIPVGAALVVAVLALNARFFIFAAKSILSRFLGKKVKKT